MPSTDWHAGYIRVLAHSGWNKKFTVQKNLKPAVFTLHPINAFKQK